eukprot:12332-Amphidinium_carterae.1
MWPGVEHGPWASAAVSIWPAKLTWKPRCAWTELFHCVPVMHTLTSRQERISPGSGTSGTKHPSDTRAWLYRSRLSAHPRCVGRMSMNYPFLSQQYHFVEAWLDQPWRQLVGRIGEAKNPGPL